MAKSLDRHLAAATEGMRQCAAIDIFQLAAQRYAMRQPARPHLVLPRELRQVMRCGFAFDGGVGGDDQLLHLAFRHACRKLIETQFTRANAIERTQSEAKKIVAEAEQKVTSDVKVARQKIVGESESLARLAAERILGRPV